ncbi:acyl carrier protein [Schleiferilactobacillus harbinensis]|jgi:acyl carrier protein|uniref:acyl carrier protein n=1 Tax=Schleiferilactobacillus harbinensis TaxID=304207 RepID=UPI002431D2E5|nr:acyl carrier protein [Schleiferilactobacillus harbinensis]MCI1688382.1 acyl carrier protein [Schleiferilactobacillus harbinensis]MCI1782304.1 acyl carrier protein [Schleiferilactobacillus harbinensis]MCI1850171.1 acyl carrier protein [Schleiferilactobacillus harbinensis]
MSEQEIFDKIQALIADRFEIDPVKITNATNFKQDLSADSLDLVEFVLTLEDTFGGEISDEDADKLNTVGDVVQYIAAQQK